MDDACSGGPLSFIGAPVPHWVRRRVVAIEPGMARRYDETEWRDALVVVERGEVVLECTRGGFTTFRKGDVIWLVGVPLRTIHNRQAEPAVLVAIARRASVTEV